MKNTRSVRLIACLLALVMIFGISPFSAFAADEAEENTKPVIIESGKIASETLQEPDVTVYYDTQGKGSFAEGETTFTSEDTNKVTVTADAVTPPAESATLLGWSATAEGEVLFVPGMAIQFGKLNLDVDTKEITLFAVWSSYDESGTGLAEVNINANTFAQFEDSEGTALTEFADANPNLGFWLRLSCAIDTENEEIGTSTRMVYTLPEDITVSADAAATFQNEDVNVTIEGRQLVFTWKNEKKDQLSARIAFMPNIVSDELKLSGHRYVITNVSNTLGSVGVFLPQQKSDSLLRAEAGSIAFDAEGKLIYAVHDDPFWSFTNVTGNWYYIEANGSYIHIDGNSVTLSGTPQALLVTQNGTDTYQISDRKNGYRLDAKNGNAANGIQGYVGNSNVRLYAEAQISQIGNLGLGNKDYYIGNLNNNDLYRNLLLPWEKAQNTNYLAATHYNDLNGSLEPQGIYATWHFENAGRNYYYITSSDGRYLSLQNGGASLSNEPEKLLVMTNGTGYSIMNESPHLGNVLELDCMYNGNNKYLGAAFQGYLNAGRRYMLRLYSNASDSQHTDISGQWAIINPDTGRAVQGVNYDNGDIQTVVYTAGKEENTVEAKDQNTEITLWSFNKVSGKPNWYTVTNGEGQYLAFIDKTITVSGSRSEVYIQNMGNGRIRLTNGETNAMNVSYFNGNNTLISYSDRSGHEQMLLSMVSGMNNQDGNLADGNFVVTVALQDEAGKPIEPANMNPNKQNKMILTISEDPETEKVMPKNTRSMRMYYTLNGQDLTVQPGENDVVAWTWDDGMKEIVFQWKGEKQGHFTAEMSVVPRVPATVKDLSGSYVLGTAGKGGNRVMLGSATFSEGNRGRIRGILFHEVDGKIVTTSQETPVWTLTHVSGDYYTVYSENASQYLKIVTDTNGIILENANQDSAQKILLTQVKDGYYAFSYENRALNNSSFDAGKGFASYDAKDKGDNAILKLYPQSAMMDDPIENLTGRWIIANANVSSVLSDGSAKTGILTAINSGNRDGVLIPQGEVTYWSFEHVLRDWYTIRTESGYLNISDKGVFVTDTQQSLLVRSNDDFASIVIANGDSTNDYTLKLTNNGFGSAKNAGFNNDTKVMLKTENDLADGSNLIFNINGGTVAAIPTPIAGEAGEMVSLPELNGEKNGNRFIGWSEDKDFYSNVPGTNSSYRELLKPGTAYKMEEGIHSLYAVYNDSKTDVRFGIRVDGVIQDEPNNYNSSEYKGHFWMNGILKEGKWVIDIKSDKPVKGWYIENNVTANLTEVPTAEQIAEALMNEGNIPFDPETQYVHWYVLKRTNNEWHVDGVIRSKQKVSITYNTNFQNADERLAVQNMPGAIEVSAGSKIYIGAGVDGKTKTPSRKGYVFTAWNTKADGSGTIYSAGESLLLNENLNLYAQWAEITSEKPVITITSDWAPNKPAYAGTAITLTATLYGFEDKEYTTLQWQHSTDLETWEDEPNATGKTFTYILDDETSAYTWRVVAKNVKDKK